MKKIVSFIFIILTCFHNIGFAEIIQTKDTKVVENILTSIDTDTLVIFDVDDVLMYPDDKILRTQNADACKELVKQLKQRVGKDEIQDVTSIILLARKNKPVDPKMINLTPVMDKR